MTTNRTVLEQESTLSDERLEDITLDLSVIRQDFTVGLNVAEAQAMARELLGYRKASKEIVCYLTWHQGCRAPDDCEDYVVEAKPEDKSCDGSPAFPVYACPNLSATVPGEIDVNDPALDTRRKWIATGWNACRAAMLKQNDK